MASRRDDCREQQSSIDVTDNKKTDKPSVANLVEYVRQKKENDVITKLCEHPDIIKQSNFDNLVIVLVQKEVKSIFAWLLKHSYNNNAALDIAINNGSRNFIKWVAKQDKIDIDAGLYFAVKTKRTMPIGVLLYCGANINTVNRDGKTPLHFAIINKCDVGIIKFLIRNAADITIKNNDGLTAPGLVKKLLNNTTHGATKIKLEQIQNLFDNELNDDYDEPYTCLQSLSDVLRGYAYQIKILTLYAIVNTKLAISEDCDCELGTEGNALVPFDDIFSKIIKDGRSNYEFVQVKHTKKQELNKIAESDFFTLLKSENNRKDPTKGNDTVIKLFRKFDEIRSSRLENEDSAEFIYCTNTSLETPLRSLLTRKSKDDLLCGVGGVKWQIKNWRYVDIEIRFFLLNLIMFYVSKFTKIVIDEFKNDIEVQINILSRFKDEQVSDKYENDEELWSVLKIAKEGVNVIEKYLEFYTNAKIKINNSNNKETVKINIPDECQLPSYKEELCDIKNDAINKINDVLKSLKCDKELFVHFSKNYNSEMIEKFQKFIQHFCIYTECPSSDELDDIITKELSEEFKFYNSKLLSYCCINFFTKWVGDFKNNIGYLFKRKNGAALFHDLRVQIFKGFSKFYSDDLLTLDLHFRDDNNSVLDFLVSNNKMLHVITEFPNWRALRVLDILKSSRNITEYNNDNTLFTNSEFIFKSDYIVKHLLQIFSSTTRGGDEILLLVISLSNYFKDDSSLRYLLSGLRSITEKSKKKIIVFASNSKATKLIDIFQGEYVPQQETVTFKNLSMESQANILNRTVIFKNNRNSLEIKKQVKDFMTDSKLIDEEILSIIINNKKIILIGDDKPFCFDGDIKEYFIPRRIHHQVIDKDVLKYIEYNLYFITGMSKKELKSTYHQILYGKDNHIHFWQEGECFDRGIILMPKLENNITNYEVFAQICIACVKNIYWLEFRDRLIFLKDMKINSRNEIRTPLKVLDMNEMMLENYSFNPEDLDRKIVILANNSGEGKTTMLTGLSYAMTEKHQDLWVVRVDLKHFVDIKMVTSLNNITFSVRDTAKAIKTIVRMALSGDDSDNNVRLERIFLEASLNGLGKVKVVLFVDGFDEISPDYKEKTCVLLKALKNSNVKQMWITTRVHLKEFLEEELQEPAHVISSLTEEEQIEFLNKFWKYNLKKFAVDKTYLSEEEICAQIIHSLKVCYKNFLIYSTQSDESKMHRVFIDMNEKQTKIKYLLQNIENDLNMSFYGKTFLKKCKEILRYENTFFTVPLNLIMVAEIIFKNEWKISNLSNRGTLDIFKAFIENKYQIYREKSTTKSSYPADKAEAIIAQEAIEKMHREVAVMTFFPHLNFLPELNITKGYTIAEQTLITIGLVKSYGSHIEFTHRSYGEYFFCEYLSIHLDNPYVQFEILPDILAEEQYDHIRALFEGFLSQIESKPCSPKVMKRILEARSERENTVMHVVLTEEHQHIQAFILRGIENYSNAVAVLLKFQNEASTLLDIETWADSTDICDIIRDKIKKYPDVLKYNRRQIVLNSDQIVNNSEVRNTVIEAALEHQNSLKSMLIKKDRYFKTALDIAIKSLNLEVCNFILASTMNNFDEFKDMQYESDLLP